MNVRWLVGTTAAIGLLLAGSASASHRDSTRYVSARVVDVQPVVRLVTVNRPRRECWQDVEYRSDRPLRVAGTTLAGGVIGAAIGRQFGDGSGRDALTVLGGMLGSAVANEHARRNVARDPDAVYAVPVERCRVVNEPVTERVVDAYAVTYRYQGRLYRMRTREHPGEHVRLRVDVRPVLF